MKKHVIVVANPHKIPGGLETVRAAAAKFLPHEHFELVPCRVRQWPRFSKKPLSVSRRSFAARDAAFKKHPDANVVIAFESGLEKVVWHTTKVLELVRNVSVRSVRTDISKWKYEMGNCGDMVDPATTNKDILPLFESALSIDLKRAAKLLQAA